MYVYNTHMSCDLLPASPSALSLVVKVANHIFLLASVFACYSEFIGVETFLHTLLKKIG